MDTKVQRQRPPTLMNRIPSGYTPSDRTPTCPREECRGSLLFDPIDPTQHHASGLDSLVCPMCGHRGMKARLGLLLLAHDGDEYRFSYGPSLSTLTIILSRKVMHLFPRDMSPVQLATSVAEWVLLTGREEGTIELAREAVALSDCHEYLRRHQFAVSPLEGTGLHLLPQ
jgi:hypothetical protein